MTDNIAHDLKSPITRIRGPGRAHAHHGADRWKRLAGTAIEECDRLLAMIDTMLFISRTEAGRHPAGAETDSISPRWCGMPASCSGRSAEDKRIRARLVGAPERLPLMADDPASSSACWPTSWTTPSSTPPRGARWRSLSSRGGRGGRSSACGTPGRGSRTADLPHVFERFYRGDPSRSQPGAGLGLELGPGRRARPRRGHNGCEFPGREHVHRQDSGSIVPRCGVGGLTFAGRYNRKRYDIFGMFLRGCRSEPQDGKTPISGRNSWLKPNRRRNRIMSSSTAARPLSGISTRKKTGWPSGWAFSCSSSVF